MNRSARKLAVANLALVVLMLVIGLGEAQPICGMSPAGFYACRPSVVPPNPPPPSADCCMALSHANLRCFCGYRNSGALPSLGIDPNLAAKLPEKCRLPNLPKC